MATIEFFRIVFALVAVLGLIGIVALAVRNLRATQFATASRRLALVETLAIGPRRRAAILSCDGREHLLVLDQDSVMVVEQGIPARAAVTAETHAAPPPRKLGVPPSVIRMLQGRPLDETVALRAAGVL